MKASTGFHKANKDENMIAIELLYHLPLYIFQALW